MKEMECAGYSHKEIINSQIESTKYIIIIIIIIIIIYFHLKSKTRYMHQIIKKKLTKWNSSYMFLIKSSITQTRINKYNKWEQDKTGPKN